MRTIRRQARLGTVALALAMIPVGGHTQTVGSQDPVRTIRVSGNGEVRVQPDVATVQFAVETVGQTAEEAGQANAAVMSRLIEALVREGVSRAEIQTSGYGIHPEYAPPPRPGAEPEPAQPRIRGYRAMNQVSVRSTELERVGGLIDVGLRSGANRLHGVSFEVADPSAARSEALGRAVQDARRSAETLASALGVRLGAVLDASTTADPAPPMFRSMSRDLAMSAESLVTTPIEPGEQTIRAIASVVFLIE